MNNLRLKAKRGELLKQIVGLYPEWKRIDNKARRLVGPLSKREVQLEQGAAITLLAAQYNRPDVNILEIGACRGYSAALIALATPQATVTTLEPHSGRRSRVRAVVGGLEVTVRPETSTAFLDICVEQRQEFDFIFVDGDHANVALDLPYWNLIKQDGLFLHHDYSPLGSERECFPVWEALNHFSQHLDHQPDVLVQDESLVGLAGWYRRDLTEVWPPEGTTLGEDGYLAHTEEAICTALHPFDASPNGIICRICLRSEEDGNHEPPEVLDATDELADQDTIDTMRKESGTLPTNGDEESDD